MNKKTTKGPGEANQRRLKELLEKRKPKKDDLPEIAPKKKKKK